MNSSAATLRAELEATWDELVAAGTALKDPYQPDDALRARLDGLAADSPERAVIYAMLLDWLAVDEGGRWHAAYGFVQDYRVPGSPQALRAAARNTTDPHKKRFAANFLRAADQLERELAVPTECRAEMQAWWDSVELDGPALVEALDARLASPSGSCDRQSLEQLIVEWLDSNDPRQWQTALQLAREHQLNVAIPALRAQTWNTSIECVGEKRHFRAVADEIAAAIGRPDAEPSTPRPGHTPPRCEHDDDVWFAHRILEVDHDLLAERGRITGQTAEADGFVADFVAGARDREERREHLTALLDWLESADPWRWIPALNVLRDQHYAPAVPILRRIAATPITSAQATRANAFTEAADTIQTRHPITSRLPEWPALKRPTE